MVILYLYCDSAVTTVQQLKSSGANKLVGIFTHLWPSDLQAVFNKLAYPRRRFRAQRIDQKPFIGCVSVLVEQPLAWGATRWAAIEDLKMYRFLNLHQALCPRPQDTTQAPLTGQSPMPKPLLHRVVGLAG